MKRFLISFLMFIILAIAGNADAAMSGSKCFDDGLGHESCFYINQTTRSIMYKKYGETAVDLGAVWDVEGLVTVTGGTISAAQASDVLSALGTDPISVTVNFATGTELPETAGPGEVFIKADGPEGRKLYYSPSENTFEQVSGGDGPRPIIPASADYNLTPSEINNNSKGILVMASAALDVSIPEDMCDTATGVEIEVKKTTGDTVSIYSNDPADQIITSADVALTAGYELDLAAADGSSVRLCCAAANKWYVIGQNGTPTNGGARDGGPVTNYLTDADVIAAFYFEEDLTDETSEGNNLTDHGTITFVSTPTAPQGTYSADFNGSTQYASSSDTDFDAILTDTTWSITGKVYFDTEHYGAIFSMGGTSGGRGITLYRHDGNDSFYLKVSTNGTDIAVGEQTAVGTAPINTWLSYALVFDGTNIRFYIDGYESTGAGFPKAFTGTVYDTTADFWVGRGYIGLTDTDRWLNGKLDRPYLISRALTAEEVLDIHLNGLE